MRKFLENTYTFIIAIIGLIGGYIWAKNTNWHYEPSILFFTSAAGVITFILLRFLPKEEKRPFINLELVYMGGLRTRPHLTQNSPTDETGKYFQVSLGGLFYFEVTHDYNLLMRNNSENNAYNLVLFKAKNSPNIYFKAKHNALNPITIEKPFLLELKYTVAKEMTHQEADKLNEEKFPEEIKNMLIIAVYQNENQKTFITKFYPPKDNEHLPEFDISEFEQIS